MIRLKLIGNITYIRYTSQKKLQLKLIQGDRFVDIYKSLKEINIRDKTEVYYGMKYLGVWRG